MTDSQTLFSQDLFEHGVDGAHIASVSRRVTDDLDYVAIWHNDDLITVSIADVPRLIAALQAASAMPAADLCKLHSKVAAMDFGQAEPRIVATDPSVTISTMKVAPGLFGEYPYPVQSVHAIYSDRGKAPGQVVEVGYVARTTGRHDGRNRIEWVVKNREGQLWSSFGGTMRDAIAGAAKDGIV